MEVRGLKSFVGVIMGFPLQSNHELLQNKCPQLNPQQDQLITTFQWEVAGKRPATCKLERAQSSQSLSVCVCDFYIHFSIYETSLLKYELKRVSYEL